MQSLHCWPRKWRKRLSSTWRLRKANRRSKQFKHGAFSVADVFNKKKRSQIMSKIRGKNTSPEKLLHAILRGLGFKTERHRSDLPGSPDIVLSKQKAVLFTNGCFWHGHKNCLRAALPATNRTFWKRKIEGNKRRDQRQKRLLRKSGWTVLTFWTCKRITSLMVLSRLRKVGLDPRFEKE
jgi:DNA mismatch endonuclease (patch repair protein)